MPSKWKQQGISSFEQNKFSSFEHMLTKKNRNFIGQVVVKSEADDIPDYQ